MENALDVFKIVDVVVNPRKDDPTKKVYSAVLRGKPRAVKSSTGRWSMVVPKVQFPLRGDWDGIDLDELKEMFIGSEETGKVIWVESLDPNDEIFQGNEPLELVDQSTGVPMTFRGAPIYGTSLFTKDPSAQDGDRYPRDTHESLADVAVKEIEPEEEPAEESAE